jgi:hypothetical protein
LHRRSRLPLRAAQSRSQLRRGPVNFKSLRSTNSKGVSGNAETLRCFASLRTGSVHSPFLHRISRFLQFHPSDTTRTYTLAASNLACRRTTRTRFPLRYFTPAPTGPGPPPSHHDADLGMVYRGGVLPGFASFPRSTLLPFKSAPTPLGPWALRSAVPTIPHTKSPHNNRTRWMFMVAPPWLS